MPKFIGAMDRVWSLLRRGREVPVDEIYSAAYTHKPLHTPRIRQQYAGAIISALNARLASEGKRIVPGEQRRTYRVSQVG